MDSLLFDEFLEYYHTGNQKQVSWKNKTVLVEMCHFEIGKMHVQIVHDKGYKVWGIFDDEFVKMIQIERKPFYQVKLLEFVTGHQEDEKKTGFINIKKYDVLSNTLCDMGKMMVIVLQKQFEQAEYIDFTLYADKSADLSTDEILSNVESTSSTNSSVVNSVSATAISGSVSSDNSSAIAAMLNCGASGSNDDSSSNKTEPEVDGSNNLMDVDEIDESCGGNANSGKHNGRKKRKRSLKTICNGEPKRKRRKTVTSSNDNNKHIEASHTTTGKPKEKEVQQTKKTSLFDHIIGVKRNETNCVNVLEVDNKKGLQQTKKQSPFDAIIEVKKKELNIDNNKHIEGSHTTTGKVKKNEEKQTMKEASFDKIVEVKKNGLNSAKTLNVDNKNGLQRNESNYVKTLNTDNKKDGKSSAINGNNLGGDKPLQPLRICETDSMLLCEGTSNLDACCFAEQVTEI